MPLNWSAGRLKSFLRSAFPNDQLIVASYRQPYSHIKTGNGVRLDQPASGLVTAMEPVMRASGGTWVAHASGNADAEVVDGVGVWMAPPHAGGYRLRRLWFSPADQAGHLDGFSNAGLWPLCHDAELEPVFTEANWRSYQAVNQAYADAIVSEARTAEPVILIHDYQLALVPAMVRARLPRATVIAFWHIPWARAEQMKRCPWLPQLIEGWLGSDVAGFQTSAHRDNFLVAARWCAKRAPQTGGRVIAGKRHSTWVDDYAVSIAWPASGQETPRPAKLMAEKAAASPVKLIVGVDRFDYTKGLLEKLRALEVLLTQQPAWLGKFHFIQVAAPSRTALRSYRAFQAEVKSEVLRINKRFGRGTWQPISLRDSHHHRDEVNALYRAADVCWVGSLQDGMNLVCKEFVAARDDEHGVLVLSQFAGASDELTAALIVNPHDSAEVALALERALTMPASEARWRMRALRRKVENNNVHRWAASLFIDAAHSRTERRGLDSGHDASIQAARLAMFQAACRR